MVSEELDIFKEEEEKQNTNYITRMQRESGENVWKFRCGETSVLESTEEKEK